MTKLCDECQKPVEEGEVCSCQDENIDSTTEPVAEDNECVHTEVEVPTESPEQPDLQIAPAPESEPQIDPVSKSEPPVNSTPQPEPQVNPAPEPDSQSQTQQAPSKELEWFQEKKNNFVSESKTLFAEILPILKAPVTRIKQISSDDSSTIGMKFIITKAAIMLILTLIVLVRLSGLIGYYIEIPFFKAIIQIILFSVGADFLEALLMKTFTEIAGGSTNRHAMITIIGTRGLYESIITIVVALLSIISLNTALIVYIFCIPIVTLIQYSGFQAITQVSDDKKPYIFFVAKACMFIMIYIIMYLLMKDTLSMVTSGIGSLLRYM